MNDLGPIEIKGIHHLKFPVTDMERSLIFYEKALGAKRIVELDHKKPDGTLFAMILQVPGFGDTMLELKFHPGQAKKSAGFDPITIAVYDGHALEAYIRYLDTVNIPHSPVITALFGWLVVIEDPDGRRVRFYTLKTHGPELPPDESPWLTDPNEED